MPSESNTKVPPSSPLRPEAPNVDRAQDGVKTGEPKRTNPLRTFAAGAMPRVVGYGLLLMFLFDLVEIMAAYHPMNPQSDAAMVAQVLERIAVPLIAYVLIFLVEPASPGRLERFVRKVLSFSSLLGMVACLALALVSVTTGLRLNRLAGAGYQKQLNDRTAFLQRVKTALPTLTEAQMAVVYNEMIRKQQGVGGASGSLPEMRRAVDEAIPGFMDTEASVINDARRQTRIQLMLSAAKYALGGLVSAVLFLFLWEASYPARAVRVFRHRHGPSMEVEDRMASWFERLMMRASEFSPLPNLEDYRWFRRIRRAWRHWRESRRF